MAAAALVLQFLQFRRDGRESNAGQEKQSGVQLDNLEKAVQDLNSNLRRVLRGIESGSKDSDAEFFDARVRVAETSLLLDLHHHDQVRHNLAQVFANVSALTIWINSIIGSNPSLAARLGMRLEQPLDGVAAQLNQILATGGAVRQVIAETQFVMSTLLAAIEEEMRTNTNI